MAGRFVIVEIGIERRGNVECWCGHVTRDTCPRRGERRSRVQVSGSRAALTIASPSAEQTTSEYF